MNQKALLLAASMLLAGALAAAMLLNVSDDEAPGLAPSDLANTPAQPAAPVSTSAAAPVEASASVGADTAARDAVTDMTGKRPVPDGSAWITLTVVDAASQSPVPGAEVFWYDEKAWELLRPQRSRHAWDPSMQQIWRMPEAIAGRVGWQTRCDDKGQARVSLRDNSTVAAMHDGKFGQLHLRRNTVTPNGGHRVLLNQDHTLSVLVVDDADQPCSQVPINVQPYDRDNKEMGNFRWQTLATTGDDGTARLPHLQQLQKQAQDEELDLSTARWHVRTMLPGVTDRGVAFAFDQLPSEPVVLRLAPSGSIKVRATNGGTPVASFERASMQEDRTGKQDPNNWTMPRSAAVAADGFARFHHVPLGCRFHISDNNGGMSTVAAGPLARGQEIEVVLRVADDAISLTGRIIDKERQPIADQQFMVQARGPSIRHWGECSTDTEGRFLTTISKSRKDNKVDELTFTLQTRDHEQPLRAELSPRTLRPGLEDVGDLVLSEGTLVVGGRLVAGDAAYTKEVNLDVEFQEPPVGNRQPRWRSIDNQMVFVDGKGSFRVAGKAGNGRHRLTIHPHEALPITPVEFKVGEKDLVVAVDPGAPLAASVLMPPQVEGDAISAVLIPAKPPEPEQKRGDGRLTAHPDNGQEERYDLQWAAVPLGAYALELRLRTKVEPLLRLEAIQAPGPDGGDPRLVDIDLRAFVRKLTVSLLDPEGKPLDDADGMLFAGGQSETTEWTGQQFWSPQFSTLVPSGQLDLLLCTQGFRPQPLRIAPVGGKLEVRLDPWPTIEVVIPNVPPMPKGTDVYVRLEPTAGPTGTVRNQWGSNNRSDYMAANGNSSLANGRCKVAIGDGPHKLRVYLQADRRSHEFAGVTPTQVLATDASVLAQISEEQWKQAIAAITPPPK